MTDDVAKRFRGFIRRKMRSGAIETDGPLDLAGDQVFDAIAHLGKMVFHLEWNSGPPIWRRGTEIVYRLGGRYFRRLSGPRWAGPFATLLDSLGGVVRVGRATKSVRCAYSEWTDEQLIAHMELVDPQPVTLINAEAWRREDLERVHSRLTGLVPDQGYLSPDIAMETLFSPSSAEEEPAAVRGDPEAAPLLIAPTYRGTDGQGITCTSGPADPPETRTAELRRADGLLRTGMVALDKCRPRQLERAERCFREALDLLLGAWAEPHPRISYALDRIGLVRHLRGDLDAAENLYLRSLRVLRPSDRPTFWNEVTLLNLARIYRSRGRQADVDAVMRYFGGNEEAGGKC